MERDFYNEIKTADFKPITYRLYNKIDDDKWVNFLSKKNNEIYGIDDFVYHKIDLNEKEAFLLSMHTKKFLSKIFELCEKVSDLDCIVDIDYNKSEVNVIKLKTVFFE